ncbi:MAG: PAS domain S-box protein, partial [Armatimonadota bacterium]|nr:PAS domain S-box protein [Armatimonadota bacterium]
GMAYVVILHLSPDHESSLPEVIKRETALPVTQVTERVRLQPDHVYVIAPDKHLAMEDGHLKVAEPDNPRGRRVPIDLFFRSLAEVHDSNSAVAILSGTGADGTVGIKRIKERGGLVIAQNPEEAQHDGMPRSAIETGIVDFVLPVAEMPQRIIHYFTSGTRVVLPQMPETDGDEAQREAEAPHQPSDDLGEQSLQAVLKFVREQTGHDFSQYKRATLLRRIARRLQLHGLENLPSYMEFLHAHPEEAGALLQEILISVTNFFRDAEAFHALRDEVLPRLFAGGRGADNPVRVWVPGCATGEEAYSLAMLFCEHIEAHNVPARFQIFATDLDEESIVIARHGSYPETIAADVSPERLRRFFLKQQGRYCIQREIRDNVLFALHDLLSDTAFSRLDLISCRNLLIYFNRAAQEKAFDIFHFALNPDGFLFLGSSESAEGSHGLFSTFDKKHRIYQRRPVVRHSVPVPNLGSPGAHRLRREADVPPASNVQATPPSVAPGELHLRLLDQIAPPSIMVDGDYNIVHLSPQAGRFLQFAGGEPTHNVVQVAHPDLQIDLRSLLLTASQRQRKAEAPGVRVSLGGEVHTLNLVVRPAGPEAPEGYLLIVFDERGGVESVERVEAETEAPEPLVRQLESEIARLRTQLRDTVENYETSTEELRASNEELQSINEELRSATEELETSKEELQSVNEELSTVNSELKLNNDELARSNNDLQNLMASTQIGTIFLDRQLHIKRFTPHVQQLFNVLPTDAGRPLSDITSKLNYAGLSDDAERVLRDLAMVECEVANGTGQWFLARLLPYRTLEDKIDGVVLTFVDITRLKRAEEELRASQERFRTLSDAVPQIIWTNEMAGKANYFNQRWFEYSGLSYEESAGPGWQVIVHPADAPTAVERWQRALATGEVFDTEYRLRRADGVYRWHIGRNVPLRDKADRITGWFGSATDVEDMKQAEAALRESEERFRLLVEGTKDYAMFLMDEQRCIVHWNTGAERIFGYTKDEAIGQSGDLIFTPEDCAVGVPEREAQTAAREGRAADNRWHMRRDGTRFWADGVMTSLSDAGGTLRGFAKIARDATKEREAAEELRRAHDELETRVAERTVELERMNQELQAEVMQRKQAELAREQLLQRQVQMQEEERRRISRELHDQMGQQLTALLMGLDALPHVDDLGLRQPTHGKQLESLQKLAAGLMDQMHRLAWELRPAALDNLGLDPALRQHVQEWAQHSGIQADFVARGLPKSSRLPAEVETALYRVVQEALTNVQRHAEARRVSVLLERRDNSIVAIVEDDGRGFEVEQDEAGTPRPMPDRLGLLGMLERLELVGGTLTIESAPGQGTTIYACAPLEQGGEPRG